jgi:hypothetical protein
MKDAERAIVRKTAARREPPITNGHHYAAIRSAACRTGAAGDRSWPSRVGGGGRPPGGRRTVKQGGDGHDDHYDHDDHEIRDDQAPKRCPFCRRRLSPGTECEVCAPPERACDRGPDIPAVSDGTDRTKNDANDANERRDET